MIRIAIAGAGGRMGTELIAVALADPGLQLVGGVVRAGTAGGHRGRTEPQVQIVEDLAGLAGGFDVLIDFTNPAATLDHARWCASSGAGIVAGATGFSAAEMDELQALSSECPLFYARNMSVGVNSLLRLLPVLAAALDGYDIEIVEAHHRYKADAPSGTALALAEALRSPAPTPGRLEVHGRSGHAPRVSGEVGFHSVRAGGNAGEHTVIFANEGEEVHLVHRAYSRRTFAMGAVRAAHFLAGQPPGLYGMNHLLA